MSQPSPDQSHRRPVSRSATERRNVRGDATRQSILLTAERLFAQRGISAVPLRDIAQAAGQRNHAVVQYHFGDRDEVVRAIVEFRGAESETKRIDLVTELMLGPTPARIDDVVGAFVRPLAIHIRPDNHYLTFLSHFITKEGGYEALGQDVHTGGSVIAIRPLLARLAPQIPAEILDERWYVLMTSVVHTLARYQSAQAKPVGLPADLDVLIEDLITFLSAGLTAPVVGTDPRTGAGG
jgi:AcrR family transcriptional regulator